jgi:hypothetical protein
MTPQTDAEKDELKAFLDAGSALPEKWLHRLFPNGRKAESVGKEYRLVYEGSYAGWRSGLMQELSS